MPPKRVRADVLLTDRALAPSRERARAYILAGKVFSRSMRVDKAGQLLEEDAVLEVRGPDHSYVSRGGVKLAGALEHFALEPSDRTAADIGASTGGFTDCLLQRGARRVYAIDVGHGQLHENLRADDRVIVMERTNARHLISEHLGGQVEWVVADVSFIGLGKILPAVLNILEPRGTFLALVKPQFEVARADVARGGVVRDAAARERAIARVAAEAEARGFRLRGQVDSRLRGPKGNLETFLWLEAPHSSQESSGA